MHTTYPTATAEYVTDAIIRPTTVLKLVGLDILSSKNARLFATDCAERVLHLFEASYPEDHRLQWAIEMSRNAAVARETTPHTTPAFIHAYQAADAVSRKTSEPPAAQFAAWAVGSAAKAAITDPPHRDAGYAADWVLAAVTADAGVAIWKPEGVDIKNSERLWQQNKLDEYYADQLKTPRPTYDLAPPTPGQKEDLSVVKLTALIELEKQKSFAADENTYQNGVLTGLELALEILQGNRLKLV